VTHKAVLVGIVACGLTTAVRAQQSDTIARHDSTAHASSGAASLRALTIGAIADLLLDVSPDGSTLESERRFELREIQLSLGAGIERRLRGDIVLSLDDSLQLMVMEASLSTVGLPRRFHAKAGRFHLPFGKLNARHRVMLPTIDYPLVIQRFLGSHGGMGTGLSVSKGFDLAGAQQEVQLTAIEKFPDEHAHDVGHADHSGIEPRPSSPANKTFRGLGYTARLRSSWRLGDAAQFELSGSAGTGKRAHAFGCDLVPGHAVACPAARGETGVNARQSLLGADVTVRVRPDENGPTEWLLIQAEFMRQHNEQPALPRGAPDSARYLGPTAEETGAYLFARWRINPRLFFGGRVDWLDPGDAGARDAGAGSVYVQLALSEIARITATYERVRPSAGTNLDRLLMQAVIALGAHRPHAP
jgi:hypothetical protein